MTILRGISQSQGSDGGGCIAYAGCVGIRWGWTRGTTGGNRPTLYILSAFDGSPLAETLRHASVLTFHSHTACIVRFVLSSRSTA
jgi:hypothetical protein